MRDARVPGASSAFNSSGSKRTYSSLVNSDPFTVSSQGTISDHDSGLPYCYTTKEREPGDQARPVGRATRPGQGLAGDANLRHVRICLTATVLTLRLQPDPGRWLLRVGSAQKPAKVKRTKAFDSLDVA